jgi:hypothetical protein
MKTFIFCFVFSAIVMGQKYESQSYEVVKNLENVEVRYYPPAVMAEVQSAKNSNNNFSDLFRYITGNNARSEEIAMTTPVHMQSDGKNNRMAFVLPKKYNQNNAPIPTDSNIKIYTSKSGYFAAVRYGGYSNETKVQIHTELLLNELQKEGIKALSEIVVLSYDSPYKFYNRRNEVLVEVSF